MKGSPERVSVIPGCERGGNLDKTLVVMSRCRSLSPQLLGVGTPMQSIGAPNGSGVGLVSMLHLFTEW